MKVELNTKADEFDGIIVTGAREHNLKNVSVRIPRNQITVFTGLSGSGKSSLAFDTIYAEGQRRYVESLSHYARQFLEQLKKPELDSMTGLQPAIAIDQKSVTMNPRSTVGTVTEVYDYLRLLFAKVGTPHCPEHGIPLQSQTPSDILQEVKTLKAGTAFYVLAPMAQAKKGEFLKEFQKWHKQGFVKARVDGKMIELEKAKKLAKTKPHDIELVIDQLIMKDTISTRLSQSINTSLSMTEGRVLIEVAATNSRKLYSLHAHCSECGMSFMEVEPRLFSFNHPRGACPSCHGLGTTDLVEEKVYTFSENGKKRLDKIQLKTKEGQIAKGLEDSEDDGEVEDWTLSNCSACQGTRLRPEALSVFIDGNNIAQWSALSIRDFSEALKKVTWSNKQKIVSEKILKEIQARLSYMIRVGTSYLSLSRTARTLSGGEAQRLRLATQVGSSLIGVLYVMDEPSIGLHPRDHHRLLEIIGELRDRGNTILLVEHDEDTIRFADHVVDIGPRAGHLGGELMVSGTPAEVERHPTSLTAKYLRRELQIPEPLIRRAALGGKYLNLLGASGNNLKNVDLKIPLGTFCVITGVSGSGKSTLILDTLYRVLAQKLYGSSGAPAPYKSIQNLEALDQVIDINQRPIGRTPRSTPATYVGLFPLIRDLFSSLPESKLRGYAPGRFSFNVKGGRCETCKGHGQIRLEMHFMSDVFVICDDCQSKRYNKETLSVKYRGKSIADILAMPVLEAEEFFRHHKIIHRKLDTLLRVGLDYMTLGQSSTTISGGEAQRVKLSKELSKRNTGKTMYILDEPTTGLHFEDVRKLVELLQELVSSGSTAVVIEHHLEVIKCADHIIDLGPDGGSGGGEIVATGAPDEICKSTRSALAPFLRKTLKMAARPSHIRNKDG